MENELDEVARGDRAWPPVIAEFYTPFIKLLTEKEESISKKDVTSMRELGIDQQTQKPVSVRLGRFGPYVQLGTKEDVEKPKFASLLPGQSIHTLTLAEALDLLSLPRIVGQTETGENILAGQGRFGPYLKVGSTYTSIKNENPLTINMETATRYIQEAAERKQKKIIKEFPASDIKILFGRFGAYITNGTTNARIPKDTKPEDLELAKCETLLTEAENKPKTRKRKKS
jgi:DNA topoisomerase-1